MLLPVLLPFDSLIVGALMASTDRLLLFSCLVVEDILVDLLLLVHDYAQRRVLLIRVAEHLVVQGHVLAGLPLAFLGVAVARLAFVVIPLVLGWMVLRITVELTDCMHLYFIIGLINCLKN